MPHPAPCRFPRLVWAALILLPGACATAHDSNGAIGFGAPDFYGHLTNRAEVQAQSVTEATTVELAVDIDPAGRITTVTAPAIRHAYGMDWPQNAEAPAVKAALSAARHWRLRPFLYRNHPVAAQSKVPVRVLPPEHWDQPDAAFPDVDGSKLRISLSRRVGGLDLGGGYTVTVAGDGHLVFESAARPDLTVFNGRALLPRALFLPGRHEDRIDPAMVQALVTRFQAARFFGLAPEYKARQREASTVTLTVDTGHGSKTVVDQVGREMGLPQAVKDLEDEVDRVAGTARWTGGAPGLVDWLTGDGFDFTSDTAAVIAVSDYGGNAETTILQLMDRGLDLEKTAVDGPSKANPVGAMLMSQALSKGQTAVFTRLAALGWLARLAPGEANRSFAWGAAGCNGQFARMVTAAGLPVDAPATTLGAGDNATALIALASSHHCRTAQDRLETAAQLLALGADPNRRDSEGRTALFRINDLDLLELLLVHGADPALQDKTGRGAVLYATKDAVTLRLLEAGAKPDGRDTEGHILAERAARYEMPATARWLATHGQK